MGFWDIVNYDNVGSVINSIPALTNFDNQVYSKPENYDIGRGIGTLISQGSSAALGRTGSDVFKGQNIMDGMSQDVGQTLAGTGVGLLSNWTGRGVTSAMNDSRLGRGVGTGIATAMGSIGGTVASNLLNFGSIAGKADKLFGTMSVAKKAAELRKVEDLMKAGKTFEEASQGTNVAKASGTINPYGLAMTVAGTALGAVTGPSKEYGGTYGNITRTMDSIYDVATSAAGFLPGGQVISGAMALNKGLSNIFGSTDGMTKTDAILGSAFMLAPVKWLNMAGAKTTDTFKNLSWLNTEKADTFMGNAFGDLNDKFAKARAESGKTYGMFSHHAYTKARDNINFANGAWNKVLAMADLNELLKIRSLYMSSINNLRYAQMVNGGFRPLAVGKQGMKIFNNATNHNMAMRLLSGAALIDNKQMILCNALD